MELITSNPVQFAVILAVYGLYIFGFFKAPGAARKKIAGAGLMIFLGFIAYWAWRYHAISNTPLDSIAAGIGMAVYLSAAIVFMWVGGIGAAISAVLLWIASRPTSSPSR